MTLNSLLSDFMLLGVFLTIGFAVREIVKPLQKLYIPASVIGGAIALICGQQLLGIITVPDSWNAMPGTLISIIMTALIFGVSMNLGRVRNYLDYSVLMMTTYGVQICVGMVLGGMLSQVWEDMPYAWGLMGVFAFWGGHGNTSAIGTIFQENGFPDNLGLGMILATIGLMVAIIIGMIMVNWGVRKGYASYLDESSDKTQKLCGAIPKESQKPIAFETAYPSSINSMALQFIFLMICLFLGNKIVTFLAGFFPALSSIPMMARGMLGALIVWPVMVKTKLDAYADKRSVNTISGFCLEIVVFAAISTLRLDLVTKFFIPILIYSVVFTILMIIFCVFLSRKICKKDWFEKCLLHFGQSTGTMATGLALLRCVDPELKSSAAESASMANTFTLPITAVCPALLPLLAISSQSTVTLFGLILMVVCLVLGRVFFWNKGSE